MEIPSEVMEICEQCTKHHRESVDAALDAAHSRIRGLPNYHDWIEEMVRRTIRSFIHDYRGKLNSQIREETRRSGNKASPGPSLPGPGTRPDAEQVIESYLATYHVAGTVIGNILGGKITALVKQEDKKSTTAMFNRDLLLAVRPKVPDNKRIKEALTDKQFNRIWNQVHMKHYGADQTVG